MYHRPPYMVDNEHRPDIRSEARSLPLAVRLGEPFLLPFQLTAVEQEYQDGSARLETIPLTLEALGPGRVVLYRDWEAAREAVRGVGGLHPSRFRTPAGPLHLTAELAEGRTTLDPHTLPVSLVVYLDAVPVALLPTETEEFITCTLAYEDRAFAGIGSIDTVQTGPARELAFLAWTERVPDTAARHRLAVLFPQDPSVLRRIVLTLDYEA